MADRPISAILGLLTLAFAGATAADNLLPNGDFENGLTNWQIAGETERVGLDAQAPYRGRAALRMDATSLSHEVGAESAVVPIEAGTRYRLRVWVKQTVGYGAYKAVIDWLDAANAHLSYANDWTGHNYPLVYAEHGGEFVAPPGAAKARLLIAVAGGSACLMDDFVLESLPPLGPKLKVYVFCAQRSADATFAVEARIQNEGDQPAREAQASLRCSAGLRVDDAVKPLADLLPGEHQSAEWVVRGELRAAEAPLTVRVVAAGAKPVVASTRPFVTIGDGALGDGQGVPTPRPAAGKVLVGTYYFPVTLDWDRSDWGVRHVDYLNPLLGYYDEALPEVADWHIKWAAEHGIDFFAFDWYYNDGSKYIQDALEKGFLKARHRSQMKFCINWCNEGQCTWDRPLNFSTESLCGFMTYLCEHYFTPPEYLRVDGRPVVMIIRPDPIIEWHGGPDGSRRALDAMREVARKHGPPDLYLMCIGLADRSRLYKRAGYDAITAYALGWADASRYPNGDCEYEDLVPEHERLSAKALENAQAGGLAYMPPVWTGWDDYARARDRCHRTRNNTAARFRALCEIGKRYVDPKLNMLIIEAWNEWGEGGFLEPSKERSFSFLDAVRDVFTSARGLHQDTVPTPAQVASYDTPVTFQQLDADYIRRDREEHGVKPVTSLDWQFDRPADRAGWFRTPQLTILPADAGCLKLRSTGADPALLGPALMDIPTGRYAAVELRMAVDRGTAGQLFWLTEGPPTFSEQASRAFPLIADGAFHVYRLPVAENAQWAGTIHQLRLDPTDAEGASIAVAYLRGLAAAP
ncbi:MAG: hypothetical protein GW911_08275 [Armatimonadetes bacterium]|nr:hypothetical protein [Armatimonadota bacterium]PIU95068.1 MAG: hypothetical protein COS65_04320 [Armatimonadetes bacterium CG06_land_8_20_14_3_00_66_21]